FGGAVTPTVLAVELDDDIAVALRASLKSSGVKLERLAAACTPQRLKAHTDVLAILLGRVPDPVRIAQRCHMIAPGVTVLIVADGTTCTSVEEQLRFAPFIRSDVQCVPARPVEHLLEVVRGTLSARRRRLDFQRIVAALNRKLSDATTSSSRAAVLL